MIMANGFGTLLFTLWTDKLLAYIFSTKGMIVHPVFVLFPRVPFRVSW